MVGDIRETSGGDGRGVGVLPGPVRGGCADPMAAADASAEPDPFGGDAGTDRGDLIRPRPRDMEHGAFLAVQEEFGSFDRYVWRFVGHEPVINRWRSQAEVPSRTPESEALSKDLALHGFNFVGPTIGYSFMQSVGMVNDHIIDCFRHEEVGSSD
jgi:DNA-3-methyladenine glycosylase I